MATAAAAEAFRWWREARGAGNEERGRVIEKLCAFLDAHGKSRFEDLGAIEGDSKVIVRDRAGWFERAKEGTIYYFSSTGMREALKGFDFGAGLDVLQAEGIIDKPGANGERAKTKRFDSRPVKVYEVASWKLPS
jgi:putative DNA primase/helicase